MKLNPNSVSAGLSTGYYILWQREILSVCFSYGNKRFLVIIGVMPLCRNRTIIFYAAFVEIAKILG
jgi:hypothetical protein